MYGTKSIYKLIQQHIETDISNEENDQIIYPIAGKIKNHYIILLDRHLDVFNSSPYWICGIITHSEEDNILIQKEWLSDFQLHGDSYMSRDIFMIYEKDIDIENIYGKFNFGFFRQ
jgi:hypothetical protein